MQLLKRFLLDLQPFFERHDRLVLPLDSSSVELAVDWFDRKALGFTKTYVSLFFNPHYQKGMEATDVVLGMTFPRAFARGRMEHRGTTYYFFTEESRQAFEADPDRYVGAPGDREGPTADVVTTRAGA